MQYEYLFSMDVETKETVRAEGERIEKNLWHLFVQFIRCCTSILHLHPRHFYLRVSCLLFRAIVLFVLGVVVAILFRFSLRFQVFHFRLAALLLRGIPVGFARIKQCNMQSQVSVQTLTPNRTNVNETWHRQRHCRSHYSMYVLVHCTVYVYVDSIEHIAQHLLDTILVVFLGLFAGSVAGG